MTSVAATRARVAGGVVEVDTGRPSSPEVCVADTDFVFKDAAEVLTGAKSVVLSAIDSGAAVAYLSLQAFEELGRLWPRAARGWKVDGEALRDLVVDQFLPRMPVVDVGSAPDDVWLPTATDVKDPDDVDHAVLARLISARAVYSLDRDLRRPGYAPRTPALFSERLANLEVAMRRANGEHVAGLLLHWAGTASTTTTRSVALRLGVRPAAAGVGLGALAAASLYLLLRAGDRRARLAEVAIPLMDRLIEVIGEGDRARAALCVEQLVPLELPQRLEVRVARHLARSPDRNMGEIASELALTSRERRELSILLPRHPSFERSSQYGWAVGRIRERFETDPPRWRPPTPAGTVPPFSPLGWPPTRP